MHLMNFQSSFQAVQHSQSVAHTPCSSQIYNNWLSSKCCLFFPFLFLLWWVYSFSIFRLLSNTHTGPKHYILQQLNPVHTMLSLVIIYSTVCRFSTVFSRKQTNFHSHLQLQSIDKNIYFLKHLWTSELSLNQLQQIFLAQLIALVWFNIQNLRLWFQLDSLLRASIPPKLIMSGKS